MSFKKIQNHPYAVALAARYDRTEELTDELGKFIRVSADLTGFSEAELQSTGLVATYFEELALVVGRPIRRAFLLEVVAEPASTLVSPRWSALARNLIRMWYIGQWKRLPDDWESERFDADECKAYDEFNRNLDRVISPAAYQEGLVWRTIGVNPPGAKQPGFASWTRKL